MSEENVNAAMTPPERELIANLQRMFDAYNRGDFDLVGEFVDPDVELVTIDRLTELRGVDEFRAWLEPTTVDTVAAELEQFEVAGNNVLVRHFNRGRGLRSGISHEIHFWAVWTFNEAGLVTRCVGFRDDQEANAREAAGLSE
ncbi:MAG: nuclear transport factor 2 family protein [Solirubrobacterales bacterium]|nr:nuclear transport factor 2 family protein [Solirubrobacterales bacterium]